MQIIIRLQKRAARIILDAEYSTPSVLLFLQLTYIVIFDLIKFRQFPLLLNILINPNAPPSFKLMFNFLSATRQHARTRACLYDLKLPYQRSDSGKRTFLCSASILFNALDSDWKQLAMSTACTSDAFTLRLTTTKRKFRNYFLHKLICINHLEDHFLRQL